MPLLAVTAVCVTLVGQTCCNQRLCACLTMEATHATVELLQAVKLLLVIALHITHMLPAPIRAGLSGMHPWQHTDTKPTLHHDTSQPA